MFNEYNIIKNEIDNLIINYFPKSYFNDILNYSIETGKRIRPILLLESYKMLNKNLENHDIAKKFAIALEFIHNYSLVHDDLPSMDNDNYRRGRKSTHYKYGEDLAILAGDALLNKSYEIIFEILELKNDKSFIKAAKYLSNCAGLNGMILGQVYDINDKFENLLELVEMYKNKTCKLIMAATVISAYISNSNEETIRDMEELGFSIGMAFQLQDDLLDIKEDESINKVTYVSFVGEENTKIAIENYTSKAISILKKYENNDFLIKLIQSLIERKI